MKKNADGAISIFMIIITMSCFLLGGIFIDATRILVAQNKVQLAMDASVRSAMSYYDDDLVNEFGLYAVNSKDLNDNFNRYFKINMLKGQYEGINLFEYQIYEDETSLTQNQTFSGSIKEQIVEYDKYRVVPNVTIAFVDRLKDAFGNILGKAKATQGATDDLSRLNDAVSTGNADIKCYSDAIKDNIKEQGISALKGGAKALLKMDANNASSADIRSTLASTMKDARAEITKMESELKTIRDKRDAYVEAAKKAEAELGDYDDLNMPELSADEKSLVNAGSEYLNKLDKEIASLETEIHTLKSGVDKIEKDANKLIDELDTLIAGWQEAERQLKVAKDNLAKAEKKLEQVKKEKGLTQQEKALADCQMALNSWNNSIAQIYKGLQSDQSKQDYAKYKQALTDEDDELLAELDKKYANNDGMLTLFEQCRKKYDAEQQTLQLQSKIDKINDEITAEKESVENCKQKVEYWEKQVTSYKEQIETKNEKIQEAVGELSKLATPDIETGLIPELKQSVKKAAEGMSSGLVGEVKEMLEGLAATMTERGKGYDPSDETGALAAYASSLAEITKIGKVFSGEGNSFWERCMYVDYIMNNFTYLTSQTDRNHYFNIAEVEYILYGQKNQAENISSTLMYIYTVRVALDSVDYACHSKIPNLLGKIVEGVLRGLVRAVQDVVDMVFIINLDSEDAPGCYLIPSLEKTKNEALKLSYSDHLRLMLLLMFDEKGETAVDNAINATLTKELHSAGTTELYTSANASVKVGVNLLMIPVFTDLLPMDEYFKDGQYIIHRSTSYSY